MNIEDRIASLETAVKTELAALAAKVETAFADEQGWCERYWDYVALAAFTLGIVIGLVA